MLIPCREVHLHRKQRFPFLRQIHFHRKLKVSLFKPVQASSSLDKEKTLSPKTKISSSWINHLSSRTRIISQKTKDRVFIRDSGRCCYKDPLSHRLCGSANEIHYDHIKSYSSGGSNSEN